MDELTELACDLIEEIQHPESTKPLVGKLYGEYIDSWMKKGEDPPYPDVLVIHDAITKRWGEEAIEEIKQIAWGQSA